MRNFSSLLATLFTIFTMLSGHGATFPLTNFQGDYLENATVKISDHSGEVHTGVAKILFRAASTGKRGKLKIHATIKIPGEDRSLSETFTFKPRHKALCSNLAPGLDDGHLSNGHYSISARRIAANFPFVVGSTTGKGTLQILIRARQGGTAISITQKLFTSALAWPITWTFKGFSRTTLP